MLHFIHLDLEQKKKKVGIILLAERVFNQSVSLYKDKVM